MKILITSGGTSEYIDDVRILTNISTGKLGAKIADKFLLGASKIHPVSYIHGKCAVLPQWVEDNKYRRPPLNGLDLYPVGSVAELMSTMEGLVPTHDVIIHAMAVSDFGFRRDKSIKLKSNDPQAFIDYMRDNITVNPKVISHIKKWNPKAILVGFKFEVGKNPDELYEIASESMRKNKCDLVVANDKEEMVRERKHVAYIIDRMGRTTYCAGKDDIATKLVNLVETYVPPKAKRHRVKN
jgi:phosphopantothenate--cysteine ligase